MSALPHRPHSGGMLLVLIALAIPSIAFCSFDIPPIPKTYVVDSANLLSPAAKAHLETALYQFNQQNNAQIMVATFPSLEGEELADLTIRIAEVWRPGHKSLDTGALLFVFEKERALRIEVGYGLEGIITDAAAKQTIEFFIIPQFKQGNFDQGILLGIHHLLKMIDPNFESGIPSTDGSRSPSVRDTSYLVFLLTIFSILLVIDLVRYGRYHSTHRITPNAYSFFEWFFRFAILFFVLKILFEIIFYSMIFSRGGGRSYGSRSGFGGGFSSGGGSFGGGGASGRW